MSRHVLIATTIRWVSAAQLALAFVEQGWTVDAVCPPGHPMALTTAVTASYAFNAFRPLSSFRRALLAARPDLVIPMDDLAATYLHRLHAEAARSAMDGVAGWQQLHTLLQRSLGELASVPLLESRAAFASAAQTAGVAVPRAASPRNREDLLATAARWSYPVVLKVDGASGGEGVRLAHTPAQAASAFARLRRPLGTAAVLLRLALDGNRNVLAPWIRRRRRTVSLQSFVPGRDANIAVACRQGEVLASIAVEALHTRRRFGPSAVVRVVQNPAMLDAATRMVGRLGLSGLCGFDFVLDAATGAPVLIEMNARATPVCHLALGPGHDLVAALCSAIEEKPLAPRARLTENPVIGLFPLSWQIDPASEFLPGAYRDLPRNQPALVQASLAISRRPTRAQWQGFWSGLAALVRMRPRAVSPEQGQ